MENKKGGGGGGGGGEINSSFGMDGYKDNEVISAGW